MQSLQIEICRSSLHVLGDPLRQFSMFTVDGTTYLLCGQNINSVQQFITVYDGKESYLCGFLRFVNLSFYYNLVSLIQIVESNGSLSHNWIALYELLSYRQGSYQTFCFQGPAYGEELQVPVRVKGGTLLQKRIVSNCFCNNGQYFYFLEKQVGNREEKSFGQVIVSHTSTVKGFCFQISRTVCCVPLDVVLNTGKTRLRVHPSLKEILSKTVYLQKGGSNSTGTLVDRNNILTVKHAFPTKYPEVGDQITVKIYPYQHSVKALIKKKSILSSVDAVLLTIQAREEHASYFSGFSLSLQHQELSQKQSQLQMGSEIMAIGFGKYNYPLAVFSLIDRVFPTIVRGILSKKIQISSQVVAFKTDASLYHGFSGCGIWEGNDHIGMAVFIIKNSTTYSNLTKQNFSLSTTFLNKYLLLAQKPEKSENIQNFLKRMDKVGVREEMVMMEPKL